MMVAMVLMHGVVRHYRILPAKHGRAAVTNVMEMHGIIIVQVMLLISAMVAHWGIVLLRHGTTTRCGITQAFHDVKARIVRCGEILWNTLMVAMLGATAPNGTHQQ